MNVSDGMNYAPKGKPQPVVKDREFVFSAVRLDHGHIYGMCNGLTEAGGTLKYVYDPDKKKVAAFLKAFPQARAANSEEEALNDPEAHMIAGAAVTSERCALGLRAMDAGKDYFTDKAPFTTLEQLASARAKVKETGKKYMVYYAERLHDEGSILAGYIAKSGDIGKVISVTGFGPHRLGAPGRPAWFFEREKYGGILCDIGSHQFEQFLYYAEEEDAVVTGSRIGNFAHPEYPELEDFGDAMLTGKNGSAGYFKLDWFTPDGLRTWGDGRMFILGTKGFIEIRKYVNLASEQDGGCHVYLVNGEGEKYLNAAGVTGYPFFGQLILDCLNRTATAGEQSDVTREPRLGGNKTPASHPCSPD